MRKIDKSLMDAIINNSKPFVISMLIKVGADINAQSKDGWTPLMYAARFNSNPIVIIALIEAGADANSQDKDGKTAWDIIQDNEYLRDTDAYWALKDRRFE